MAHPTERLTIARHGRSWVPLRLGSAAWSIARDLRSHIELWRIFSLAPFRSLVFSDLVFPLRHLSTNFLLRRLTAHERTICALHHYRFLLSRMSHRFVSESGLSEIPLMEHRNAGRSFSVTLGLPSKVCHWEGESLLQLLVDGLPIYQLQFTIVPGWVLHSQQQDVIFVQRLQGVKGCFEEIDAATRAFDDLAPPLLLVTVLQGIAAAWDVHEMAGISGKSQFSRKFQNEECSSVPFRKAYDDFFVQLGATRISDDIFSMSFPLEGKPIELIGNGHKARTRRRRAFRQQIANRVCQTVLEAHVDGFGRCYPARYDPVRDSGADVQCG